MSTPHSSPTSREPAPGTRNSSTNRNKNTSIRPDQETGRLLSALCGSPALGEEAAEALLARAIWSRLAEPGDAVAGELVTLLGPVNALDLLMLSNPVQALLRGLAALEKGSLEVSARQLSAGVKRWRPRLDRSATVRDLEAAVRAEMTLVAPESPLWPEQLADLGHHAPHVLWVRGSARELSTPGLAVVGARACTGYGSHVTAELTGEACAAGFSIVSGAAYGIDAVAHRTALATGATTIAVLAGGADRVYPAAHDQLLTRIAEQGAICSELVPGAAPTRWRFLQRNRIIAALSRAVLVTEAGVRSGTLNTAGHAAELARAVGAVPGPITSAASAGCHRIVREYGATLITNGAELRELLGVEPEDPFHNAADGASAGSNRTPSLHLRVLDALPLRGDRSTADTAVRAGVSVEETANTLAELELLRYVARVESQPDSVTRWRLLRRE